MAVYIKELSDPPRHVMFEGMDEKTCLRLVKDRAGNPAELCTKAEYDASTVDAGNQSGA